MHESQPNANMPIAVFRFRYFVSGPKISLVW
jgi:hypothetical protein